MKSRGLLIVCALVLLMMIPRKGFTQAGIYWSAQVMEEKQLAVGTDLAPAELTACGEGVLDVLAEALAERGLALQFPLQFTEGGQA